MLRFEFDDDVLQQETEEEALYRDLRPKHKKPVVCLHWLRGLCHKNGYTCDCYHVFDQRMLPICQFYIRGECTNGNCMFRHPTDEWDDVFCIAYARGFCARGESCTERHVKRGIKQRDNIQQYVRDAIESHRRAEERARKYTVDERRRQSEAPENVVFFAYQQEQACSEVQAERVDSTRIEERHRGRKRRR